MSDQSEVAIKRVLDLCDHWDSLTGGETPLTTQRIREAIGPIEIEKAMHPSQTIDLDGSQLDFGFDVIVYGEPCD